MFSLRDRISSKFSKLFSDSPSHAVVDQQPQARLYSEEGSSLSLIASHNNQLSFNKPAIVDHIDESKSVYSNYYFWRSKSSPLGEKKSLDKNSVYDCKIENGVGHEENGVSRELGKVKNEWFRAIPKNGDSGSEKRKASGSEGFEEAPDSQNYGKSMIKLMEESVFMSRELYDFFDSCLPNIVKGCEWVLSYSTATHGISLRTLIRKSSEISGPCLLISGDKKGAIFGGLFDCPLRPTAKRKYQGTSQTFVFTTLYGEPRLFRPTGANRYYLMCLNDLLALGGGGNFALSMEEDLLRGTSGPCDTFGNLCLAHDQEFELKDVELWGFKHASKYLT